MMFNRKHLSKFESTIIPLALFVLRSQASNNFNNIPQFFHQVHSFIHSFYNPPCTEKKQNYLIKHLEPEGGPSKCNVETVSSCILLTVFCVGPKKCNKIKHIKVSKSYFKSQNQTFEQRRLFLNISEFVLIFKL